MKSLSTKIILSTLGIAVLAGPATADLTEQSVSRQCSEQYWIPGDVGRPPWDADPIKASGCMPGLEMPAFAQAYRRE